MMTTLTITLPHTPRCLSPNAKAPLTQRGAIVAGYKKTAAKSRARNIAWGRTCEALNGRRMQPTHYRVIWFFKGPKPDTDNCLARCKAYLDGACKAMGIDDRTLDCAGIERIHDLGRAGQVEIVFERIRNNARIRFKMEYHELPLQFRGGLWDDFKLYNVIGDVRRKRAACRAWVPLIHRDCHNCAYKNIKAVPVVCNPCINEGFAVNWEPRKEGE